MKKKIVILGLIFLLVLVGIYYYFGNSPTLTEDQKNIRQVLGNPSQFAVSYIPQADDKLVRHEVWYYRTSKKEITFLQGKFVSEKEWIEESLSDTDLLPESFDFYSSSDELKNQTGCLEIEELDYLPGFSQEDGSIQIFYCEKGVYVYEQKYLTYVATFGIGDKKYYLDELDQLDKQIEQSLSIDVNNYVSSDLGFEIKYPKTWFLENGVLTSYDTGYLEKGLVLPDVRLKCDFNVFNVNDVDIQESKQVFEGDIKISKGMAVDKSGIDGPGLGDAIMFLLEKKNDSKKESLLCFEFDSSFENDLITTLKTFKFIN